MSAVQSAAAFEQASGQRAKLRGRPWPKGVSGNPSGSRLNTRAMVLFAEMATDFGGENALGAMDRALLMQACRLMARGARAKSADDAVRLTSEARRILASVRKTAAKSDKQDTSLAAYLAARYGGEAGEDEQPAEETVEVTTGDDARAGDAQAGAEAAPDDDVPDGEDDQ
jgi:hypothetical protein